MPRYLPVPADIHLANLLTRKPNMVANPETGAAEPETLSFREFYLGILGRNPMFATVPGARALRKFEDAHDEASSGDGVMVLDEDVWAMFREAALNPQYLANGSPVPGFVTPAGGLYTGPGVLQLLPFIDAIDQASTKRPSPALAAAAVEAGGARAAAAS